MGKIDVTGIDLVKFVQAVYRISKPQGMGILHYKAGELSEEDAKAIVKRDETSSTCALSMDYVHGRACKMGVRREPDNRLSISDRWYDHTSQDLQDLLGELGITMTAASGE